MGVMTTDLRLDAQLCFALYAASRKVSGQYREPLKHLGLTYPQYLVLLVLWEQDGRTVSQLGRALMLDSGTLSPLLRRMEASGFVTRARAAQDERSVVVSLTAHGRELREQTAAMREDLVSEMPLTTEEQRTLIHLVRKLT